jgi:membrane associated rhomboid family serine protease
MIGIIIIIATVIISLKGFKDYAFFEKYKFQVAAVERRKEYIRLISSGFLHADMMHLFFNMLTLYFFQDLVQIVYGDFGFLLIYLGSMLAGNFFALRFYHQQPHYSAIGASGGVSGIIFAAAAIDPHMTLGLMFIPMPAYIFGLVYFGYSVYLLLNPKQWDNLGHAAHIGGAILGLAYAMITQTEYVLSNLKFLLIMILPLIYLGYVINRKK